MSIISLFLLTDRPPPQFPGVPAEIASLRRIATPDVLEWLAAVLRRRDNDAAVVRLASQLQGGTLALLFGCGGGREQVRRMLTIVVEGDTEPAMIDALSRAIVARQYPAQGGGGGVQESRRVR